MTGGPRQSTLRIRDRVTPRSHAVMEGFPGVVEAMPARGIALTGYGRREDLDESARAGFHRHLTKAVDGAR